MFSPRSWPPMPAPAFVSALRGRLDIAGLAALHLTALAVMAVSEFELVPRLAFILTWSLLNFFWLSLLRRPVLSAALSLTLIVVLIEISRFKFRTLFMTASFIDVMIIDSDTFAFLWTIFPKIRWAATAAVAIAIPLAATLWYFDRIRVRRLTAIAGGAACLTLLTGLSLAMPVSPGEAFGDDSYVSGFARSGVSAMSEFMTHGFLESDAVVIDRLRTVPDGTCEAPGKRPHIVLVHDEGSFDIRAVDGIKVPEEYGGHFTSFDGKQRHFLVEGAGGPSWYTEYNVISGLSARSYGRFAFFVTRIAAGRVERGLPRALQRCGYRTFSIYPVFGGFLGARSYFTGTGVQHFVDGKDINGNVFEPDRFYFDNAVRMIERERGKGPMFLYVYLTANHFPWNYPFHEDLLPDWRSPGNQPPEVDEYLRRQAMTAADYPSFLARLKRDFPDDSFLVVRYGDHQPDFAKLIVDRSIDVTELGRRLMAFDPRYFTTYYAIDAINFQPVELSSALDPLDAPYLPLVVQEAAGLPLDPSFAEQKKILQRCHGMFYACAGGAEARRFNRLLIDAGLIKGL
ncbi:MAG TPA: sulfatase-like hydrolase/transferase [Xanthobacteraceae bacterium]